MAEHMLETRNGTTYHEALDAIKFLFHAVSKFEDNEEDIFKILIQISTISGNFLPFHKENGNTDHHSKKNILTSHLEPLIKHLSKHFTKKYKHNFNAYLCINDNASTPKIQHLPKTNTAKACMCLEKLSVLLGTEETLTIIKKTATRCVDNLSQFHLEYFSNPYNAIKSFQSKLNGFIADAKILSLDLMEILCLSEIANKSTICTVITDSILIRIQSEVMVLINSTLENLNSETEKKDIDFDADEGLSVGSHQPSEAELKTTMSLEALAAFSEIIHAMLDLEKSLNCFKLLKIISGESDESTITREKSALKNHSGLSNIFSDHNKFKVFKSTAAFGTWDWHESWTELCISFSTSLGEIMIEQSKQKLQTAKREYTNENNKIQTRNIGDVSLLQLEIQPRVCIEMFKEIMDLFQGFLPLAVFGMQYKALSNVTDCYEESVIECLNEIKIFLNEVISDVPEKCSIKNLYLVLATCEAVCNNLDYFARCMQGNEEKLFLQGIISSYTVLDCKTKGIAKHLLTSNAVINILHDPVSHDWSDIRDFNDGESCSHSIVIWNLELARTWRYLSRHVSEKSRNEIFSHLLFKTLTCLNNRYARCEPSYNRTKQVKRDILSILLITYSYIWHISSDPTCLFHFDISANAIGSINAVSVLAQIQTLCQNLLATLTFLTTPISVINDALNNSDEIEDSECYSWMHIVAPLMFTKAWDGSLFGLTEIASSYCALKLTSLHGSKSLANTIFAFVVNGGFLSEACFGNKTEVIVLEHDVKQVLCMNLLFIFSSSRFTVFDDDLFSKCILLAIGNDLRFLTKEKFISENKGIFQWKKYVKNTLHHVARMTLQRVVEYCVNYTWSNMGKELLSLIPESLQMEMLNLNEGTANDFRVHHENSTLLCLVLIVQEISCILHTLPSWLVKIFVAIDHRLGKQRKNVLFKLFGAQVIINVIEGSLLNVENLEKDLNITIRSEAAFMLKKISKVFKNLCENNEIPDGDENLQRILLSSMDDTRATFKTIFSQDLRTDSSNGNTRLYEECIDFVEVLQFHSNDENRQVIESLNLVKDIAVKFIQALKQKHNFGTILTKQLNPDNETGSNMQAKFNPLLQVKKISDDDFDHEIIANHELDYAELVSGHVEQAGCMKKLVQQRWDMQPGAFLQDEERSSVENVKNILNIS